MRRTSKPAYAGDEYRPGLANDSTAYDLSLFERREPAAPRVEVVQSAPAAAPRLKAGGIALFLVCAVLVAVLIYGNVCLTETYADISDKSAELALLQNEQIRLEMEVGSKVSLRSVEDYAKSQLGLGTVESYQVEYIILVENSKIEVLGTQEEGFFARLVSGLRAAVGI